MKHRFIVATMTVFLFATRAFASGAFTVPISIIDGYPIIDVSVNGKVPMHFVFDTGANVVILDTVATKLRLQTTDAGESYGDGEERAHFWAGRLHSVQIGHLHLMNTKAGVIESKYTRPVFGNYPLSGFIGEPLLESSVVELDYVHRRLILFPAREFTYSGRGTILRYVAGDISGKLDGVDEKLFVDTGTSPGVIIGSRRWPDVDLAGKFKPTFQGVTDWGLGGAVHAFLARAHVLDLGGMSVLNPVIQLSTQKAGNLAGDAVRLGYGVLSKFDVTFDRAGSRLILEKNANFAKRHTYDRAGIWMTQQGNAFVAADVIARGPADVAGVKAGDQILSINGVSTSTLVLPIVRQQMAHRAAGTKVVLLLQSASRRHTVTLTLRDLV